MGSSAEQIQPNRDPTDVHPITNRRRSIRHVVDAIENAPFAVAVIWREDERGKMATEHVSDRVRKLPCQLGIDESR